MRKRKVLVSALLLLATAAVAVGLNAKNLRAFLTGYEETPRSISTAGEGEFRARINNDETEITYELSYSNLEGTVTQAHIHFGQRATSGGISAWLCGNPSATINPPAGTPLCPVPSGSVTGTITADDVIGPADQGIAPGEFAELVRAIRAGATYANVHTTKYPSGEIRAQIGTDSGGHGKEGKGGKGSSDHSGH